MSDNAQWVTSNGRRLYPFEMTDEHIQNVKAFLERRIHNKEYLRGHSCPVDISDGPCLVCDEETNLLINWEEWLVRFDKEIRRRAAGQASATP
jgi:hypothetical protein